MKLFWRSNLWLQPGDLVSGGWGPQVLGIGGKHGAFFREMLVERARLETRPDAVSRLIAAFTFRSRADAAAWPEAGDRGLCYEVTPEHADTPTTVASMTHYNRNQHLGNADDAWAWAFADWTREPAADETAEILVAAASGSSAGSTDGARNPYG